MIQLLGVGVDAGEFRLRGVCLAVGQGEYAVLMGRSGCGKTSLLEVIAGLRPLALDWPARAWYGPFPYQPPPRRLGCVLLMGRDVTALSPAARDVGYVPQDLALFPSMTVAEHLSFALELRRVPAQQIALRTRELSDLLGIGHLLSRLPAGLSGGEAQRVALGRALSFRPPVLLLDEPLSALDEDLRGGMVDLLRRVQRSEGLTVLHVTHSRAEALALAGRLFVMQAGRVVEEPLDEGSRFLHGPVAPGGGPPLGRSESIRPGDHGIRGGGGGGG